MRLGLLIFTMLVIFIGEALAAWPGGDFPSEAWKDSPYEWFIQWKRVRKYAKVAFVTDQPQGFDPLNRQARALYLQIWRWPDGALKNSCFPAADKLKDALAALLERRTGAIDQLASADPLGARCLQAIQSYRNSKD